jgi:RNA polymerase sigma-70 factor (ECF subfamily)
MDLTEHLFRREAGRMMAVLTRLFGTQNLALAEDVMQEAFCRAVEVWRFRGVPENPLAWLMATAKHCALDVLRRQRTARLFAPDFERYLQSEWTLAPVVEEYFGESAVKDDLLRMMFSCCEEGLSEAAQVALILNVLCGFNAEEIASAFVESRAAVEKRITRAKRVLAGSPGLFNVTAADDFRDRLPSVQRALYLLFSEGYHGASANATVRAELCREAMRLAAGLLEHPLGRVPSTYALSSLLALTAARLPARVTSEGQLVSLTNQDRSRWDRQLIAEGLCFLSLSAEGADISDYHIEASIAAVHASASATESTDWSAITARYDALMALRPSPIVALNRAIAIGYGETPARGLEEIAAIADRDRLAKYPFFPAALGELEVRIGNRAAAYQHFVSAASLARNALERQYFEQRVSACKVDGTLGPPLSNYSGFEFDRLIEERSKPNPT